MVTPATVHVTNLEGRFDMTGYLAPHSDIVALLVLEHQAQMLNLITRVGWEERTGAADAREHPCHRRKALGDFLQRAQKHRLARSGRHGRGNLRVERDLLQVIEQARRVADGSFDHQQLPLRVVDEHGAARRAYCR